MGINSRRVTALSHTTTQLRKHLLPSKQQIERALTFLWCAVWA